MQKEYDFLFNAVEKHKEMILEAERTIWKNPEPGYREWKTHAYLKEKYEKLGYTLNEAGNIPGFYTEIDTGKPGPTVAVFGEMDSLIIANHPECDKQTGAVHACGHNCQSAALLGIAAALKEPGVTEGLCGKIRLVAVPAEEELELDFRNGLIKEGVIKYPAGKQEFLYRGYLDGVDIALMVHTSSHDETVFSSMYGSNGCILKTAVFKGKSAHAGGSPNLGINALYAATNAMSVANALRETFKDSDHIRFHPIITAGGDAVNAIPDRICVESYIRGASMEAMKAENDKVNRAFAGVAAAMGCELTVKDMHGMAPRIIDKNLLDAFSYSASLLVGENQVKKDSYFSCGCSDLGDISTLIPVIHPNVAGSSGHAHSADFFITDPYTACVISAKAQVGTLYRILSENAAIAQKIIKEKTVVYNCKEEYFKAIDSITADFEAVSYNDNGTISIKYKK